MWVRKQIDISFADLARSLGCCLLWQNRKSAAESLERFCGVDSFACLSVRSGFDLLLQSVPWQPGDEIMLSGLTIPHMPQIVNAHGFNPIGIDVDVATLQPNIAQVRSQISPRTRAIVVAHLFGGRCDMDPIIEVARDHGVMVIEDCAQAFTALDYRGDVRADVSMFSFGAIKTNTALGGAILYVRQKERLHAMRDLHESWPVQSRMQYAKRVAKYAGIRMISSPRICGHIFAAMRTVAGKDHDQVAGSMARGFSGPGFLRKIRHQPALPLLMTMRRRLKNFDAESIERRRESGQRFCQQIDSTIAIAGVEMDAQSWWVLPALSDEPEPIIELLRRAGFDATNVCSMRAVAGLGEDSNSASILKRVIFLPLPHDMPISEIDRMADVVARRSQEN